MHSKYINSFENKLHILPNRNEKNHEYYLGVFTDEKHDLIETTKSSNKSSIQDYFPLIIHNLNKRGNWNFLSSEDALKRQHIDFVWTNTVKIDMTAAIHSRIMHDSVDNYISNKKSFYESFQNYNWIPKFIGFNKNNIYSQKTNMSATGKPVIIKPDNGFVGVNIKVLDNYDFDLIQQHITKSNYINWTISEVIESKLIDNYINTLRVYYVVTKLNNKIVSGYYYKEFMVYKAAEKFTGNITNKHEFITNHYNHDDPQADEQFVRTRYIPHDRWAANFSKDEMQKIYTDLDAIFATITNKMNYRRQRFES